MRPLFWSDIDGLPSTKYEEKEQVMSKTKLITVALVALSQSAFAQIPPGAGGQMQQIPPEPVLKKAAPRIRLEPVGTPVSPAADNVKILVNSLNVTGQSLYSEAELIAVTGFKPGS